MKVENNMWNFYESFWWLHLYVNYLVVWKNSLKWIIKKKLIILIYGQKRNVEFRQMAYRALKCL